MKVMKSLNNSLSLCLQSVWFRTSWRRRHCEQSNHQIMFQHLTLDLHNWSKFRNSQPRLTIHHIINLNRHAQTIWTSKSIWIYMDIHRNGAIKNESYDSTYQLVSTISRGYYVGCLYRMMGILRWVSIQNACSRWTTQQSCLRYSFCRFNALQSTGQRGWDFDFFSIHQPGMAQLYGDWYQSRGGKQLYRKYQTRSLCILYIRRAERKKSTCHCAQSKDRNSGSAASGDRSWTQAKASARHAERH